jgi:magnesium chelatase family protein
VTASGAAREIQTARYADHGVRTNAEADGALLDSVATPDEPGRALLAQAAAAMGLSARGYTRACSGSRALSPIWRGRSRWAACMSPRR